MQLIGRHNIGGYVAFFSALDLSSQSDLSAVFLISFGFIRLHLDRRFSMEAPKHTSDKLPTTKQPFLVVDTTVTSVSLRQNVTRTWMLHHSCPELFCCSFLSGLLPAGSDFLRCVRCPFSKHVHATSVWLAVFISSTSDTRWLSLWCSRAWSCPS